jgi:hypothetical protein
VFLQGIINRECELGLALTDLFIDWPIDEAQGFDGSVRRIATELTGLKKGHIETAMKEALPVTKSACTRGVKGA